MATTMAVDNYHELKTIINQDNIVITLQCVSCKNKHPDMGIPYPLGTRDDSCRDSPTRGGVHKAHVLPCGHLMGKSCIDSKRENKCPKCDVLFRRKNNPMEYCAHPIRLPELRVTWLLSPEDEEHLLPTAHKADMHNLCRRCATMKSLLRLTAWAREAPWAQGPGSEQEIGKQRNCVYATDGKLNGFRPGDCLQTFKDINIVYKYPMISKDLEALASAFTKQLRVDYDGRTPPAEDKMVGNDDIMFRLGGYNAQKCQQLREQEEKMKLAPMNQ